MAPLRGFGGVGCFQLVSSSFEPLPAAGGKGCEAVFVLDVGESRRVRVQYVGRSCSGGAVGLAQAPRSRGCIAGGRGVGFVRILRGGLNRRGQRFVSTNLQE